MFLALVVFACAIAFLIKKLFELDIEIKAMGSAVYDASERAAYFEDYKKQCHDYFKRLNAADDSLEEQINNAQDILKERIEDKLGKLKLNIITEMDLKLKSLDDLRARLDAQQKAIDLMADILEMKQKDRES